MTRGGRRKGAGRPPINPALKQDKLLGLRVSDDLKQYYTDAAAIERMDLIPWCRKHLTAAARKAHGEK